MDTDPKERSDLLESIDKKFKIEQNGNAANNANSEPENKEPNRDPPDGGIRAFVVVLASFMTNGLVFGIINSYSVIYIVLLDTLKKDEVSNADVRASLVGTLTISTTFFLSPVSGLLSGLLGIRMTAMIGGVIATFGLLISSFTIHSAEALCFTYGILFGLGSSLAYTPSLAILGHYFKRYLGLVNGIVTIGSSVFTVMMPPIMEHVIKMYGLDWLFRILAVFTVGITICALSFKPLVTDKYDEKKSFKGFLKRIGNVKLWKNKKYRLWALSMPIALFGYFVPYVHIKKFIQDLNLKDVNNNLPLQCIAITSGVGRLLFGFLGDRQKIDKILLQQISFYVIGTLTIILPFVRSFGLIIVIALGMGLFEGGFIALIGPIAIELCGSACAAQAIGCMLGLAATPLSVGPPVAGAIYNQTKSYTVPFILAGISPIIGSSFMFLIRLSRKNGKSTDKNDAEKGPVPLLVTNNKVNQQSGSS